jgi:hypothetical protein
MASPRNPQPTFQPRSAQTQRSAMGSSAYVGSKPQVRRPQADAPQASRAKPPQPDYPRPRVGAARLQIRNATVETRIEPQRLPTKQPARAIPEQQAPRRAVSAPTKPLQEQGTVQIGGSARMSFTNDQSGIVKPSVPLRIRRPSPQKP